MIISPHLIVGAVIGAKTHNFGLIIALGIVSHFIIDMIPHWDYSIYNLLNFSQNKKFRKIIWDLIKMMVDGLFGLLIVLLIIKQKNLLNSRSIILISCGILISLLPDVLWGICSLFYKFKISKKYIAIHHFFHRIGEAKKESKSTFLGLATQILVIIIALFIFFF